jgi:pimeloyl-ACP methyl ester carboxylesterase
MAVFKELLNDKTNLYFYKLGQGEPILLVHGNGFDSLVWTKVADLLSKDFTVYAIDRNSFGKSKSKQAEIKLYGQLQATDILEFIEYEINKPTIVISWSSGAIFSLQAALADKKKNIVQIISFEAPFLVSSNSDFNSVIQFIKIIFLQAIGKKLKAGEKFIRLVFNKTDNSNSFDNLDAQMKLNFENNVESTLNEIKTRTGEDLDKNKLTELNMKVDFITGEFSPNFIKNSNKRLAQLFPKGRWQQIANGGHFALYEQPEDFVEKVRQLTK